MDSILQVIHRINDGLDFFLPLALTMGALGWSTYYAVRFATEHSRREGIWQGIWLGSQTFLILVLILAALLALFVVPPLYLWRSEALRAAWRWSLATVLFSATAYLLTRKYSGKRGLVMALLHLLIVFIGWLLLGWIGVLFFSFPILIIYYTHLIQAALVLVPISDAQDDPDRRRRILLLLSYAWGAQASMYVVADHSGRKVEQRVRGPLAGPLAHLGIPGLLWTRSHQVAGITTGVAFRRVDGPGAIFLGRLERPLQAVDLRTQLRVSVLDVVSSEGIHYQAVLFMAFRIDREDWSKELYRELRQRNPILRGGQQLDRNTEGVFPYSGQRVQAALSRTGLRLQAGESTPLRWDEWVVTQVEEVARQVLAQRSINDFWGPEGNVSSTLDELATTIRSTAAPDLRTAGVQLLTARVVNFRFAEKGAEDPIARQQLETWQALWQRRYEETLAQAEAEATRMKQEAWAYAQSLLLTSIAEGFERVRALHPELPPSTIALLFLSAVQDYITRYQPGGEAQTRELQATLARWLQAGGEHPAPAGE